MRIRAILFDHDGTLVDSYEGIAKSLQLTCKDIDKPTLNQDQILASIGPTLETRFRELWGKEIGEKAVPIYRKHYKQHFIYGTKILPKVKNTILSLKSRKYLLGCVTNKTYSYAKEQLIHFNLFDKMEVVYGNLQGFQPKPNPEMIEEALKKLNVSREETVLVGDTPIDILAAKASGIQSWAILGKYASEESIKNTNPDKILIEFDEILHHL
tara:strand:+ start:273 stop:908 length:636 start_codon:yes stop_codon:yes gene_type:complete